MSNRGLCLGVAVLLVAGAAHAGEVEATPVSRYGPTTSYYPDPCCRVGPVRRFIRRAFYPCCPPPVVRYAPVPVVVPYPAPCSAPCAAPCQAPAPAAWVPSGPPATLDRPIVPQATIPPPPMDVPSSLKRGDFPTPTPPVRFDRIASRQGGGSGRPVTLVQVGKPDTRMQTETDAAGRFSADLTPGLWAVYVGGVEQNRLVIRERKVIRVRIAE